MAERDAQQGFLPSILDRLIDPESGGTDWRRGYGLEQITKVVRRDLEELLNTRLGTGPLPPELVRLRNSIYAYGIPELTSLNAVTNEQREEIGRLLEIVVGRFEPRLRDIHAYMLDPEENKKQTVRFRIEARLGIDPAPEVAFDTILELTTGQPSVNAM
jgi:type VI secretion system protein ImpF